MTPGGDFFLWRRPDGTENEFVVDPAVRDANAVAKSCRASDQVGPLRTRNAVVAVAVDAEAVARTQSSPNTAAWTRISCGERAGRRRREARRSALLLRGRKMVAKPVYAEFGRSAAARALEDGDGDAECAG
mmetsp:Transcript_29228/g.86555  ORF Transcript_29228/g.86555 Transcript_29228/m.86555 type:complete len:131 (+) Transcript_29228:1163-1555(+)